MSSQATQSSPQGTLKLSNPNGWFDWLLQIQSLATDLSVWAMIDPSKPDADTDKPTKPNAPSLEQLRESYKDASLQDLRFFTEVKYREYDEQNAEYKDKKDRLDKIRAQILRTVESFLMIRAQEAVGEDASIRQKLRKLKELVAPNDTRAKLEASKAYRSVLADAQTATVSANKWLESWEKAFHKGSRYDIPEVLGPLAIEQFLEAIGERIYPVWSGEQLRYNATRIARGLEPEMTLQQTAEALRIMIPYQSQKVVPQVHTTTDRSSKPQNNSSKGQQKDAKCPCKPIGNHEWKPEDCGQLEFALTGKSKRNLKYPPNDLKIKETKERLQLPRYKNLREKLEKKGYDIGSSTASANTKSEKTATWSTNTDIQAAILDPEALENRRTITVEEIRQAGLQTLSSTGDIVCDELSDRLGEALPSINTIIGHELTRFEPEEGIFAALSPRSHMLSQSTLFDTCGAVHLVNDINLLMEGSYRRVEGRALGVGTGTCQVKGVGKRRLPGTFDMNGEKRSLILSDVAYVPGFHVNIISEARLLPSGAYFLGLDATIRIGELADGIIVKTLQRRHNLLFWEYNPI
jgi:hypothetical protein